MLLGMLRVLLLNARFKLRRRRRLAYRNADIVPRRLQGDETIAWPQRRARRALGRRRHRRRARNEPQNRSPFTVALSRCSEALSCWLLSCRPLSHCLRSRRLVPRRLPPQLPRGKALEAPRLGDVCDEQLAVVEDAIERLLVLGEHAIPIAAIDDRALHAAALPMLRALLPTWASALHTAALSMVCALLLAGGRA